MSPDSQLTGTRLFIEPPSHHFSRDRLFEPNAAPFGGDQLMAPYTHLRDVLTSHGVEVHTADLLPAAGDGGRNLYISIASMRGWPALAARTDVVFSAFFATECPAMDPAMYRRLGPAQDRFRRIYSWCDAESLEPYVGRRLALKHYCWAQSFDAVHEPLWQRTDRRLLVGMQGHNLPPEKRRGLNAERLGAFEFFARAGVLDLYGREWDQPAHRVGRQNIPYTFRLWERRLRGAWQRIVPDHRLEQIRKAWRGPAKSKSETISNYRFAICFENMALPGWITEKIFDCFYCGTVPIYLGATDIDKYVWRECYIDMRKFAGLPELHAYIAAMPDSEWQRYRDAARAYLASPDFHRFSKAAFADLFLSIVKEDAAA